MKIIIKITAAVLALLFVSAFAGCGSGSGSGSGRGGARPLNTKVPSVMYSDADTASRIRVPVLGIPGFPVSIRVKDCYENSGYYVFSAKESMELAADFGQDAALEWIIYVLDSQYTGDYKELADKNTPIDVENGGSFSVKAGQYVYIYCPVNKLTSSEPAEASPITLTVKAKG